MKNLGALTQPFMQSEEAARKHLEAIRWPDGPVCPRCGPGPKIYRLKAQQGKREVLACAKCRKQFSVTIGTIFEDSHIALHKWLLAMHLLCCSKKGMSAHQLHRMLGVTYKTAWFMAHRLRHALDESPALAKLSGIVEADECYLGGKRPTEFKNVNKMPVFSLVQRQGRIRSHYVPHVTAKNLRQILKRQIDKDSTLITDGSSVYRGLARRGFSHESVNHAAGEYVRGDWHINTVENYFNILRRGIVGVYHHVSKQHLPKYLAEFDFRYNNRKETDLVRALLAVKNVEGKRLTYQTTH